MSLHPCEDPRKSTQASAGDGPSDGPGTDTGDSTSCQAPWVLVHGGTSLSSARRSSAFRFARNALDGREAHLGTEEAELNLMRAELERARERLVETVECCGSVLSRRFAREVHQSAILEAEETMASVQAECSTAAEDHAAAVADRAATEAALATREVKIVEDSESIRRSLDQYHERLEARERALGAREAELARQAKLDLSLNREGLEAREGNLAQAMTKHEEEVAHHKGHVKKADKCLARKKADQDKEHEARLKAVRMLVSKEYASKFKK